MTEESIEELRKRVAAARADKVQVRGDAIERAKLKAELATLNFDKKHKIVGGLLGGMSNLGTYAAKKAYDYATSPLTETEIAQLTPAQQKAYRAQLKKRAVKA